MKKLVLILLIIALDTSLSAYQLVTSVYYPSLSNSGTPWKDVVNDETLERNFAKNYFDSAFNKGMAGVFNKEIAIGNKNKKDAFSARIQAAVLGFHKRAVVPIDFGTTQSYFWRTSNMIDYLAIPILEQITNNLETLDEYTTRIRKDDINKSKGKIWAGGAVTAILEAHDIRLGYSSNGQPDTKLIRFPAKLIGVQYNSFSSELLTTFQAARDANVEMKVLERMEKLTILSDDEISSEIMQFNQKSAKKDGIKHEKYQCYGYTEDQVNAYIQAGVFINENPQKGKKFIDELAESQLNQLIYKPKPTGIYGIDHLTIMANDLKANPPSVKFSNNSQCIIDSLKSYSPNQYTEYEKKLEASKESFFDSVWKAPFRALGSMITECRRQGNCN